MTFRNAAAVSMVLALGVIAASCSRKTEEPAPVASAPAATAPAGASADEWSWADRPAGGGLTTAPREASRDLDPPRSTAPRAPRASAPHHHDDEPTNRFEEREGMDREPARASAPAPRKVAYTAAPGATMEVRLDTALDSATAEVGQAVSATLDADLTDGAGHVVLPRGTKLSGTVTEAVSAQKVKKKSSLAYQLTKATLPDGSTVTISAGQRLEGKGYTKKDGAIIGGSAAGGAVLGQVLGGDSKSTAAGAIIGGAIGSGVAMSKKGEDVQVDAGTMVSLPLETPVTVER